MSEEDKWVPCPMTGIHPAGVAMKKVMTNRNVQKYICPQCGFTALLDVGYVRRALGKK
jgi:transposase-like protein